MKKKSGNGFDYPEGFERFWKEYPRKIGKYAAFRAYQVCRMSGYCDDDIIYAARNYAACCKKENIGLEYIMHPSRFLRTEIPPLRVLKIQQCAKSNIDYCNPDICPHCLYIGGGESICDLTIETVMKDWLPTKENAGHNCPYLRNT